MEKTSHDGMNRPAYPGLLQVLAANGEVIGAAFLLDAERACTCAHVINDALERDVDCPDEPNESVNLRFPHLDDEVVSAELVVWRPCLGAAAADLVILRLAETQPPGARPLRLARAELPPGAAVESCGFPAGGDAGAWVRGVIGGPPLADGTVQIDGLPTGHRVRRGFSGSPVWDSALGQVVGMMVSADDPESRVAYMIPIGMIRRAARIDGARRPHETLTSGVRHSLSSLEHFLNEYLGTPDHSVPFGGRFDEHRALDAWLASEGEPYALLVAEPGRGKSAMITQWAAAVAESASAMVALLPVSIRFGTADRMTAFELLGERLRHLLGIAADAPATPDAWLFEIDELLREDQQRERPLLVIVDGADEAAGWALERQLRLPPWPGRGVKILVTARPVGERGAQGWADALGLTGRVKMLTLPLLNRVAVAAALRAQGEFPAAQEIVDRLMYLTSGDPLLVRLYVDALRASSSPSTPWTTADLEELTPGLDVYLHRWWADQQEQWAREGRDPLRESAVAESLLALCAVALGPITRDEAVAVAGDLLPSGMSVRRVAADLGRFVIGDGQRQGYVLSHPRLRDYFQQEIGGTECRRWRSRLVDYGNLVLERIEAGEGGEPADYVIRHHAKHLDEMQAPPAHFYRLLSDGWLRAWHRLDPGLAGFQSDLALAWERADAEGATDAQLRCALLAASLARITRAVSPTLLGLLVAEEMWSVPRALAVIDRASSAVERALMYETIAPYLTPEAARRALDVGDDLWPTERAELVTALAPQLDEHTLLTAADKVVESTVGLDDEVSAFVLALLAPWTSAASVRVSEAIDGIGSIRTPRAREQAISSLAPYAGERLLDLLGWARSVMVFPVRARILAELAALAHEAGMDGPGDDAERDAKIAADAIADPVQRGETLAAIGPVPAEMIERLEADGQALVSPAQRAAVSIAVATLKEDGAALREIARAVIPELPAGSDRSRLWARIAPALGREDRRAALAAAEAESRVIADAAARDHALVALAGAATKLTAEQLAQTRDALGRLGPGRASAGFVAAAAHLPEGDALIEQVVRSDPELETLIALAPLVAGEPAAMAFDAAVRFGDRRAVSVCAPRCPEHALARLPQLQDQVAADVLGSLARTGHAGRLLAAAHGLTEVASRARALAALGHCEPHVVDGARAIWGAEERLNSLLEAAAAVGEAEAEELVRYAAEQLHRVLDEQRRAEAIVALAGLGRGAPALAPEAARLAHGASRAQALVAVGRVDEARAVALRLSNAPSCRAAWAAIARATGDGWAAAAAAGEDDADETLLADGVEDLVDGGPDRMLPALFSTAIELDRPRERRRALLALIPRLSALPTDTVAAAWTAGLHRLADRSRPELLADVATLAPLVRRVGGEPALGAVAQAVVEVTRRFP